MEVLIDGDRVWLSLDEVQHSKQLMRVHETGDAGRVQLPFTLKEFVAWRSGTRVGCEHLHCRKLVRGIKVRQPMGPRACLNGVADFAHAKSVPKLSRKCLHDVKSAMPCVFRWRPAYDGWPANRSQRSVSSRARTRAVAIAQDTACKATPTCTFCVKCP